MIKLDPLILLNFSFWDIVNNNFLFRVFIFSIFISLSKFECFVLYSSASSLVYFCLVVTLIVGRGPLSTLSLSIFCPEIFDETLFPGFVFSFLFSFVSTFDRFTVAVFVPFASILFPLSSHVLLGLD